MGKTLVIAEKPSVGRDLAGALPDAFKQSKDKTHIEGDDFVISWAVGHLVGLAAPDEYDPKLKRWRFADLPILPDQFKLVPVDERSKKQLQAVHRLMRSDDVELIVNACDAGREGELIFAYLYETADVDKPVQRLWLSSMTKKAIQEAFEHLRPGTEMAQLEAAARSRLLSALPPPGPPPTALSGSPPRRTLAAAQRLYEDHKAITYPRTSSRFLPSDQIAEIKPTAELVGRNAPYSAAARYVLSLDRLPLGRVVNDKKVDDHHALIPTRSEHDLERMGSDERRVYDLVAKRFLAIFHPEAVFERTRVETTVAEHVFRTSGRRLIEAGWKSVYGAEPDDEKREDDSGGDQLLPRLEQGEAVTLPGVGAPR